MKNTYQNSQSPSSQSTILVEKINLTGEKKIKGRGNWWERGSIEMI